VHQPDSADGSFQGIDILLAAGEHAAAAGTAWLPTLIGSFGGGLGGSGSDADQEGAGLTSIQDQWAALVAWHWQMTRSSRLCRTTGRRIPVTRSRTSSSTAVTYAWLQDPAVVAQVSPAFSSEYGGEMQTWMENSPLPSASC
jgi:hypothetical protein